MKLFYAKGTCSLAPHIVLAELEMDYELESVDLKNKTCESGSFLKINPKGYVPVLLTREGETLTEVSVLLQFLAEQRKEKNLFPDKGMEKYRCQEWLNYIATELHKGFSPLFFTKFFVQNEEGQNQLRTFTTEGLKKKVSFVSDKLASQDYLMESGFTIADAYLFNILSWARYVNFDLSAWPNVMSYMKRISERPGVMKALKEEGLL